MDLNHSPEETAIRADTRAWLEALPDDTGRHPAGFAGVPGAA